MPKHEVGSTKWLGNKMKSKGLSKLQFYCQVCQKQCRDANGFKCHQTSEIHMRNMALFMDNPTQFIDQYSGEFEQGYMSLMSTRYCRAVNVKANDVYMDYIKDKDHIHMNSTIWVTLGRFVEYLVRTNKVTGEKNEKGQWLINYVDNTPETLKLEADRAKEHRSKVKEEDRHEAYLRALVEAGPSKVVEEQDPTERDMSKGMVKFGLGAGATSSGSLAGGAAGTTQSGRGESSGKRPAGIFEGLGAKRTRREDEEDAEDDDEEIGWLCEGIVVKVLDKHLKDGKYYKKKGVVLRLEDPVTADIQMNDTGKKLRVPQEKLETVIPKPGGKVMVVNPASDDRGQIGVLEKIDEGNFVCSVRIREGGAGKDAVGSSTKTSEGRMRWFEYEDVCKVEGG